MEMLKLMVAQGAAGAVAAMADGGLLLPIFGGVAYTGPFAAMIAAERLLGLEPDRDSPARRARGRRHRGRQAAGDAAAADQCRDQGAGFDGPSLVAARRHGRGDGAAAALSARRGSLPRPADAGLGAGGSDADAAPWRELATLPERWSAPKFPLKAADFIARGIAEGPALGQVLALAEDAWLAADFPLRSSRARSHRRPDRHPFHPRSQAVNILSGFADISLLQLLLVAGVALFASVVGGLAGYGTGALMPLVLVPLIGAEPVVPIIAISSIFTNFSRFAAYLRYADRRRALIVICAAALTTALGAYGYTRLTNAGAALVIGTMLISSVPLRRLLRRHDVRIGDTGLAAGAVGYGVLVGGTSGSGVILLSLLMAVGLEGAAVIATDAVISLVDQRDQDFGVRTGRRRHRPGARLRGADRRGGAARRVSRPRLCRAHAGAYPHRDPRCRRDRRRRGDDFVGAAAAAVNAPARRQRYPRRRQQFGQRADDAVGLDRRSPRGRPSPWVSIQIA